MILSRLVLQATFGKGSELAAGYKEMFSAIPAGSMQPRILTDISGALDTVVLESTHESLAAFEQFRTAIRSQEAAAEQPNPLNSLIASGKHEYYTIEL